MIYVLIPSYNEAKNLLKLVTNIAESLNGNKEIIIVDDGSTDKTVQIINKLVSFAKKNDLVLASPHTKGGSFIGVSSFRIALSRISSFCDSLVFNIKKIRTYSSFYRVYTGKILKKLQEVYGSDFITQNGFSAGVEILVKADRIGAKIVEIPATVDWRKRIGKSKMNIFKNTLGHFLLYKDYFLGKLG